MSEWLSQCRHNSHLHVASNYACIECGTQTNCLCHNHNEPSLLLLASKLLALVEEITQRNVLLASGSNNKNHCHDHAFESDL